MTLARAKDYGRELEALVAIIEQAGAAQKQELGVQSGTEPKDGFWTVTPPIDQRGPGTTLRITSPDGNSFRQSIPKNAPTADTIRIFTSQAQRYGFDFDQARAEEKQRVLEARRRDAEETAAKERLLHQSQRASRPPQTAPKRKRKKWPREEITDCDVNPTYAQSLLDDPGDGTLRPRPIYRSNVNRFKRIITDGLWVPHPFTVDWFGFMLNGRHRLTAIIELGCTLECKIIFGADPKQYASFDTPRARTGGDTLVIAKKSEEGGQAHNHMAAALKMLDCYKNNVPWGSWSKTRVENDELAILVEKYPLIYIAMEIAKVLYAGRRRVGQVKFRPTSAIVFAYLALERFPDCGQLMDHFIIGVTLGELPGTDPRRALYNQMRERSGDESGGETIPGAVRQLALLLKTWRYWTNGIRRQTIGWRKGESMPLPVTASEVTIDIPSTVPLALAS